MNNLRRLLIFFIFLFCVSFLFARGIRDVSEEQTESLQKAEIVQVTGIVRLVGSSPMNEIVITGEEFEWYVVMEERDKLIRLQHQIVTVEAEETVRELVFASGLPAGIRRELRNIRIVSDKEE